MNATTLSTGSSSPSQATHAAIEARLLSINGFCDGVPGRCCFVEIRRVYRSYDCNRAVISAEE
jgi:hypothetical protein